MMQTVADGVLTVLGKKWLQAGLLFNTFIIAQVAIILGSSTLLTIAGGLALGVLSGFALWGWMIVHNPPVETHTETVERIVPYDQWPDKCYVCGKDIDSDMELRGQFVIHKGESEAETRAVPLCEECTWTYTTLTEWHDELVAGVYDRRGDPIDL